MNSFLFNIDGRVRSGWRAAIFLISWVFAYTILEIGLENAMSRFNIEAASNSLAMLTVRSFLSLVPALMLGWMYGKLFEGLPFRAIGAAFTKGWARHWMIGAAVGAITLAAAVLIAFVLGGLRFQPDVDKNDQQIISSLILSFLVFAVASAFEEVFFRGYLLQTFARAGLAWMAIILTSVFFGALHLKNPNASAISTINTVIAGIWFSVAYLKTRDLWLVWGMHLMWNWMQGSFFGIEVSGLKFLSTSPLLQEIDSGPVWLTGGDYGIEGSIGCTVALVISTVLIHYVPNLKPDPEMLALTTGETTPPGS